MQHAQPAKIRCPGKALPLNPRVLLEIQFDRQVNFLLMSKLSDVQTQRCCLHCCKTQESGVQSVILDFICTDSMNFVTMCETVSINVMTLFDYLAKIIIT